MRRATRVLGEALGGIATSTPHEPSAHALLSARADFRARVSEYARAMAADVIEDDRASIGRFLRAMTPIDEVRVTTGSDEDTETESEVGDPAPTEVVRPTEGPFNG